MRPTHHHHHHQPFGGRPFGGGRGHTPFRGRAPGGHGHGGPRGRGGFGGPGHDGPFPGGGHPGGGHFPPGGPFPGGPFPGGPFAGGRGGPGPRGRGRGRGRRGDVRAAVLALLAERPMHGYEMLGELEARTDGLWRPSPGSLYPALAWLEDQGLIRAVEADGRKAYELTDTGRAEHDARSGPTPWEAVTADADTGAAALWQTFRQVAVAVGQVAEAGDADQRQAAVALLGQLRRSLYLLLAGEPAASAAELDDGAEGTAS